MGWLANLLRPQAAAGWTADDLAAWLGLRPVPRWYAEAVGLPRSWMPLRLPSRVTSPAGLLAHRLRGLSGWRGWEPLAEVRARVSAASQAAVDAIGADEAAPEIDLRAEDGSLLTGPAAARAAHWSGRDRAHASRARRTSTPVVPADVEPTPVPVQLPAPVPAVPRRDPVEAARRTLNLTARQDRARVEQTDRVRESVAERLARWRAEGRIVEHDDVPGGRA